MKKEGSGVCENVEIPVWAWGYVDASIASFHDVQVQSQPKLDRVSTDI